MLDSMEDRRSRVMGDSCPASSPPTGGTVPSSKVPELTLSAMLERGVHGTDDGGKGRGGAGGGVGLGGREKPPLTKEAWIALCTSRSSA